MPSNTEERSIQGAAKTISGLFQSNPELMGTDQPLQPTIQEQTTEPRPNQSLNPGESPAPTAEKVEPTSNEGGEPEKATSETEAPQLYEVRYGDDVQKLTLDELISGNMMQRDYQHNKGQLNKERETLEAERARLDTAISDLEIKVNLEANHLNSPEMQELKQSNPTEYWELFEKIKADVDLLETAKQEQATRLQEQQQEFYQAEQKAMLEAIPEWLDPKRLNSDWNELSVYESGFGRDINTVTNHRDIVNARKAMLYDRMMSQDLEAKKVPVEAVTATPEPSVTESKTTAEQQRAARLKKTGKLQDARAVISDILKSG